MSRTRVHAPVTSGNVIIGFDVLGLAAMPADGGSWGDVCAVDDRDGPAGSFVLERTGPFADRLPSDPEEDLAFGVANRFFESMRAAGLEPDRSVTVTLDKRLTVCSGLGSSASSAVAVAMALNEHFGRPFDQDGVLELAAFGEGLVSGAVHLDNVAPCLLGGICLMAKDRVVSLPWPDGWRLAYALPSLSVPTREARAALPARVDLSDTVAFGRRIAEWTQALHTADADLARGALDDPLIEPHRASLVPGFLEAKAAALAAGALGCSLSGSGPATLAVAENESTAIAAAAAMESAYREAGHEVRSLVACIDQRGARSFDEDES